MTERMFILDGHNLVYRAYHAMSQANLHDSQGRPTGAVYGLLRMVLDLIDEYQPEYLVCTFDSSEPTFREDLYEKYKEDRPEMPDELRSQMPHVRSLFEILEVPVLEEPGFESDDLIASLVEKFSDRADLELVIVTNDKDNFQLVDGSVCVLKQKQGLTEVAMLNREGVQDSLGVPPRKVPDYLSLIGDKVDNIPGVDGVGPTYAGRLLDRYESVEDMFDHPEEMEEYVSERIKKAVLESKDRVLDSKQLVVLRRDAPLDIDLDQMKFGGLEPARLLPFCRKLDFRSVREDLEQRMGERPGWDELEIEVTRRSISEIDCSEDFFQQTPLYGYAMGETPDQKPMKVRRLRLVLTDGSKVCIIGVPVEPGEGPTYQDLLNQLFSSGFFTFNQKLLQIIALRMGIESPEPSEVFDLQLGSYLVDPDQDHGLNDILSRTLQTTVPDFDSGAPQPVRDQWLARRAFLMVEACEIVEEQVEDRQQDEVLEQLEKPLTAILARMEYHGIRVDTDVLNELSSDISETIKQIRQQAIDLAGEEFNPNSPKQLRRILFEELELPVKGKTSTGKPSTDADTLESLVDDHPIAQVILDYRRYNKIESTYLSPLVDAVNPETGRIHTEFNQTIAATGRLSSSNPNLQNIPVRDEFGRKVRKAFVATGEDDRLIAADYSQVELRILAHMSGDETLIEAFRGGKDIHSMTAADIFDKEREHVDEDDRRVAKVVNYGITYGLSAFGLANDLDITQTEAEQYIQRYFERYPGVKAFIDQTIERARERGYVETLWGRRRYIPELTEGDFYRRQFAERAAVNARIQGTAADLIKKAMIDLDPNLDQYECRLLLQVHDELVLEANEAELDELVETVRSTMSEAREFRVPITVSVKTGLNWGEVSK